MKFQCALASPLTRTPRFPLLATPKVDGIRCYKLNGLALTRSGKRLPNLHVRAWIEANCPDGFDGELTVHGLGFHDASGALMSADGEPDFTFHVFDYLFSSFDDPYSERAAELAALSCDDPHFAALIPVEIRDADGLTTFEERCLAEGFEGVVLRDPDAPYVCGRASEAEAAFLKLKRTADLEGRIVAVIGEDKVNALHVEAGGRLYALGTGFSLTQRADLWTRRATLPGQLVSFSFQPSDRAGIVPGTFRGIRDPRDL